MTSTTGPGRTGPDKTRPGLGPNNIFDKKYYATTGFYDTVVYGDQRSAEVTLRARF